MSRIGGGPDRPKRDISPEMRRRGVEARRVDGGGKARERRGDDRKWSAVGDRKGRAREGRPQKLPILLVLGFARTRRVNVLDGLFLWAFMASHKPGPTFISLSLLVLELNTVVKPRITKVNAYMYTLQRRI